MATTYTIECVVCGDRLTTGPDTDVPYVECGCTYLRLTPTGATWIRDGRGDNREGYTETRGLHVTKTEEATNARHRAREGDSRGDGGSDS